MPKRTKEEAAARREIKKAQRMNKRHPPHLKGKAIGMFYARRHQKEAQQSQGKPLGTLLLSESRKDYIREILNTTNNPNSFVVDGSGYEHIEDSAFKRDFLRVINETIESKLDRKITKITRDERLDKILYDEFQLKQENLTYLRMWAKRSTLPSYKKRDEILELINDNQIVVISGETGCGKTTQVAQFILDDYIESRRGSACRIVCTQPRRISAVTVAERVADERAERLGNSVGYHIRMERRFPRERGSICFCTTGIILKMMEDDAALSRVSHLILDEIHERDVMSDFILALFKKIIKKRRDLKLILMSATLNSEKFSRYYNDAPHINIPGFTYPVTEYYLEDVIERTRFQFEQFRDRRGQKKLREFADYIGPYVRDLESKKEYSRHVCSQLRNPNSEELNMELILALLINICTTESEQGAILVFVTGFQEISRLHKIMRESNAFPEYKYVIFPLHSLMPTIDQKQIFETPPRGKRKIIIATNIAETSITIDDVVFVVDCGKIKVTDYDATTNSESLKARWVSLANANQRRGRAGRVKPGICFHLFSKYRKMELEQYQKPEILRKRLDGTILTAKMLQLGQITPFFQELIDSPDPEAVLTSINLLKRLNAITNDEKLTPLGYHLAKLPMAPQLGKMILFGSIFSCLDPVLSIAATLDFKDPFQLPLGQEKQADQQRFCLSNGLKSDHLLFHETLKRYEACGSNYRNFCWEYFLSTHTLKMLVEMKNQFAEYLHELNFIPNTDTRSAECNINSHNISLIKAIVCAGLYPNVTISNKLGKLPMLKPDGGKIKIHPKSILATCKYFDTNIMVYYRKIFSAADFVHDGSIVYPLPIVFFGDNFRQTYENGVNLITINQYYKFKCTESTAICIKELRDRFNWFLEYKISHPGPVIWGEDDQAKLLKVIMELITCEDMQEFDADAFDDRD